MEIRILCEIFLDIGDWEIVFIIVYILGFSSGIYMNKMIVKIVAARERI